MRRQQLAAAIEDGSDRADALQRAVEGLESNIGGIRAEAEALAATGPGLVLMGLVLLVCIKIAQSLVANWALEQRFSEWSSDRSIRSGLPVQHIALSAIFMVLIVSTAMLHYSFPGRFEMLSTFPTDPDIRLTGVTWVEDFIAWWRAQHRAVL